MHSYRHLVAHYVYGMVALLCKTAFGDFYLVIVETMIKFTHLVTFTPFVDTNGCSIHLVQSDGVLCYITWFFIS